MIWKKHNSHSAVATCFLKGNFTLKLSKILPEDISKNIAAQPSQGVVFHLHFYHHHELLIKKQIAYKGMLKK